MTYPGSAKTILIGKEATWGTAVTADKDVGVMSDDAGDLPREITEVLGLGKIEVLQVNTGNVSAAGTLTAKFQHGRLLEYAIGSVAHVETTSDWKHTFTAAAAPSFTLESSEDGTTDTARTFAGCLVETCEITVTNTQEVTLKVDWKGKTVASTAVAAAQITDTLITFPKSLVTISLNAVAALEIQEFTITIEKKVVLSHGVGSNLPQQGHATSMKFKFAGKLGFQDKSWQEIGYGGTAPPDSANPTGIEVILDADNGVALGSGQRQLKITLENCQFSKTNVAATIEELVFIELAGSGTLKEAFSVDDISNINW